MPSSLGALGRIDPLLALWVPFLLFAGLILWMYWTLAHKPGGQPIGALERVFAKVGKALRPPRSAAAAAGSWPPHDQPAILPVAADRLLHGAAVRHPQPRRAGRPGRAS